MLELVYHPHAHIQSLSNHHIELINGEQLVQNIIEHKLGIKEVSQEPIFELDEDFFNQFSDK